MLMGNNFNNSNNQKGFVKPLGNHFENNTFVNKNQEFQKNIKQEQKNIFTKDIKKGTISLEEFNKRCEELGKKRTQ